MSLIASGCRFRLALACFASLTAGSVSGPLSSAPIVGSDFPDISAVHVRRHLPSDAELSRTPIEYSVHGLRARDTSEGEDLELIQNFSDSRMWFVDRRRGVSHEVSLDELAASSAFPETSEPGVQDIEMSARSGLLGVTPCLGLEARFDKSGTWRGRRVSAWSCLAAGGEIVARELMDDRLGLVVRHRALSGHVDELIDIRSRRFDADHFAPASRLRPVSARVLLRGTDTIRAFDEQTAPLNERP